MRRLGLLLALVGCAIGVYPSLGAAEHLWGRIAAHKRYEKLMATPLMKGLLPQLAQLPPGSVVDVTGAKPSYGIKAVRRFREGDVSIELSTGEIESGYYGAPPSVLDFLMLAFWPALGFIIPWGTVRVLSWVGEGFFSK